MAGARCERKLLGHPGDVHEQHHCGCEGKGHSSLANTGFVLVESLHFKVAWGNWLIDWLHNPLSL